MKKLIYVVALFVSFNMMAQETALLRVNYTAGDTYKVELKTNQDMGAMMNLDMTMYMDFVVGEKGPETTRISTKATRVVSETTQQGITTKFDSNTKEEDLDAAGKMMKTQMGAIIGQEVSYDVDELGKTSNISSSLVGAGDMNSIEYPKEAVALGFSWKSSKSNNGVTMDLTYKVKEISSEFVYLEMSGTTSGVATGDVNGLMQIERSTGTVLNSEMEMNSTVMGQTMKTTVSVKMIKQ